MKELKELKIGEEIRIRCVEDKEYVRGCEFCFFYCDGCSSIFHCECDSRNDNKNVHFEIVEDKPEIIDEKKLHELANEKANEYFFDEYDKK